MKLVVAKILTSHRKTSIWWGCVATLVVLGLALVPTPVIAAPYALTPASAMQASPTSSKVWNLEIYIMNADGSDQRNLTQNPADDHSPVWSLDVKKIAFVSDRDGGTAIYILNADGTNIIKLTEATIRVNSLAWSPNSEEIAVINPNELYVINGEGSGDGRKLISGTDMAGVSWSPDGKRIAFSGKPVLSGNEKLPREYWDRNTAKTQIYIINTDGSNLIKLTDFPNYWAQYPAWSIDGKRVAFFATGYLVVMNADGSNWVTLSSWGPVKGLGCLPSWSPDDKKIAFGGRDGKIHIVDLASRSDTILASGSNPVWSCDNSNIAFVKERKVHVIDLQSGVETELADGGYPAWSPDGKKIAFVKAVITPTPTSASVGSWVSLALAPSIMENSALVWDGGDNIYAYSGTRHPFGPYSSDTDHRYYCYSISGDSWRPVAVIPDNNAQPSGLIWLEDSLYAFDIWCYLPSADSWTYVTHFPGARHIGSVGITKAGKEYIYVHDGTSFWRYSVSENFWETVAEGFWCPPNPCAMVWTGGDFIYGFSASEEPSERSFWRYSISSNSWFTLPLPPGQVAAAQNVYLTWGRGDYIYLYGEVSRTTPHLWRYSILGDTWEALEPLPEQQVAAMVATSSGVYVAIGGEYSELLGGAPSRFYFSPSPAPISVPGLPQELRKVAVHLYGQKTEVDVDEDIILELSAVNLITNPTMTVQLILQVPPGMSITSTAFIEGGGGQYTATYSVEPGYVRQIEVHIRANQAGSFSIIGYLAYYLAGDKSTAEYRTVNMPVTVGTAEAPVKETPQPKKGEGFFSCSAPAQGASPPSSGELLLGWGLIGLCWGTLGGCYGILRWRRRNRPDNRRH